MIAEESESSVFHINSSRMELILVLASVILILASIYYYLTWNYDFWQKQGIPCAQGTIPGLGNIASVVFQRESFTKLCEDFYKYNEKHSMFGFFELTTPTLLVRDPELVKSVLLTNFSDFHQTHSQISCPEADELFAINPFFSKTIDIWKEHRAPFTNAFSSKKLKLMLPLILDASARLEKYLKKETGLQNGKLELELKKLFNLYTGQISSTGIGIQGHNFAEDDEPKNGELTHKKIIEAAISAPAFTGKYSQLIIRHLPWLAGLLNLSLIPREVDLFFRHSVKNILSHRRGDKMRGNDFLQIMVDYLEANGSKIDKETELASHMFAFSIEVYETSAITLSFMAFQLASHPEVQEKLREEIKSVLKKCSGKLDYEDLREMPYFDQVLNESMRHNHVSGTILRVCTSDTQLVGPDGLSCKLKPGNVVVISTNGLQMDPIFWHDPEKFDPDRFSEEQKAGRPKFTFLPFGDGPRICVGMRMATLMMKMAIVSILKDFSLEVSSRTPLPLKKDPTSALTNIEGGLWVFLKPLEISS